MRRPVAAGLFAGAALAATGLLDLTGALARLEILTVDARILSQVGRRPPGADIVVAWIDQESMDYMRALGNPFPWPRSVYAQALEYFHAGGARAVVFDIIFDQPGAAPNDDAEIGKAMAAGPADVTAFKFIDFRTRGFDEAETSRFVARGLPAPPLAGLRDEHGVTLPIPEIEQGSELLGFINVRPDEDKVHRHYDLVRTFRGKAYPSLGLAAALLARGEQGTWDAGGLTLGGKRVPVDAGGRMALNFRGPPFTFEHVKFVNVLESLNLMDQGKPPLYARERFKDKIVIVGINADGYEDICSTPVSRNFPGPELHATAIDNLLRGDALAEPKLGVVLAVLLAAGGTALVYAFRSVLVPVIGVVLLAAAFAGAGLACFARGIVLPAAGPLLAMLLAASGAFLHRLFTEGKQKRELRRAFASYMAPEVVKAILKDPDRIRLGGETRAVTLLFTDLKGFTGLSEAIGPEALVAFLNDYFTRMGDRIMGEAGVIDKFIGDAIMAFFGAPMDQPDHAVRAVRAALGCLAEMDRLGAELAAAGRPPVEMRIGIHSGKAVVGNMGSARRFDYTAIGDTVNLASRLEGANKHFGTRCLASETTWAEAEGLVLGREVGLVRVMGRQAPIRVFEPLGLAGSTPPGLDPRFLSLYKAALERLRGGDRSAAVAQFREVAAMRPADHLVSRYLQELAAPGWDGVFSLESK